jgi:hypothetical protein
MGRGKRQATHKQQTGISLSTQLYSLLVNSHLAPFSLNRQDACSTRKFTLCGTGILPVHKKLIENGATSQLI